MHKALVIFASIILGLALTVGGSYFIIDHLIEPNGLLFEGIVGLSMGIILLMIVMVASSIGKTIMIFSDILEQTTELNKKVAQANRPPTMPGLFSGMLPGSSMTITDLETGETKSSPINPGDSIKSINDMIMNAMKAAGRTPGSNFESTPGKAPDKKIPLRELTDKELQSALAEAVKEDDYERAGEINVIINERNNSGSDTSEK
jgi:hypothetical protein